MGKRVYCLVAQVARRAFDAGFHELLEDLADGGRCFGFDGVDRGEAKVAGSVTFLEALIG